MSGASRFDSDVIAAEWAVRRGEGLDYAEREEFDRWLAEAPANWRAYKDSDWIWNELASIDLRAVSPVAERPARRVRRPVWAVMAASLVVAVLAGGSMVSRPHQSYETGRGEVSTVRLADGSHVTLGAGSQIDVRFDRGGRHVWLRRGEAVFDVHHDAVRPFDVRAGDTQVVDIGTRFVVKKTPDAVRVDVIEGQVRVAKTESPLLKPFVKPSKGDHLVRGQRLESPRGEALGPLASVDPGQVAPWTRGRLVYENASLAEVVADLNRYSGAGVELGSSDLGELRVTAALNQDQVAQFLSSLPASLPVRIEREADGKTVIVPAA